MLLRHAPRFDYANTSGQTTCFTDCGIVGSLRGASFLLTARAEGIPTAARDWEGRTALEVFQDGASPPEGFGDALGGLVSRMASEKWDDDGSSGGSFVDALGETLS